jgi:hypothetical protein
MSSPQADEKEKDGKRYSGSTSELEPATDLEKVKTSEVESIHAVSIAQHHLLLADKELIFSISRLLKSISLLPRTKSNQLGVRRVIGRFHYILPNPKNRAKRRIFRGRYTLLRILRMVLWAGMIRMIRCTQGIIQVSRLLRSCVLEILWIKYRTYSLT